MEDSADIEMVTIPRSLYEALLETIETLADKEEMESIKRALEELRRGDTISEADFLKKHRDLMD
jgi:PHD/YefM family antitoxin component YafN of YafNO toxin-antitoxin module